ncbi:MAG: sugar ABC transporter permease [Cellulomonadaceae bacterium]|nr:sugar ABC transporter permease [Cellulomonadaceae bacterium]
MARRSKIGRFDVKFSPYFYISPFFILFAITGLFPLLFTAFVATRQWNTLTGDGGLAVCGATCGDAGNIPSMWGNFQWVLHQPVFWTALRNSFSIFLLSTIPQIIVALLLAAILDANLKAKTFWRMGVLLPYVIAPSAAAIIFSGVFSDQQGLINTLLRAVGVTGIQWHANTLASHIAIASIVNFRWTGYNTLILLAAMQAIPRDVFEASVVDGAGRVRQFFSVTIPLLRPTLIFVIITSTIGGLQIFDEPQMFSEAANYGGSNQQFLTVSLLLWRTGFLQTTPGQPNMGRAAAIAWFLFIIVIIIAFLNFWLTRRIASSSGAPKKSQKKAAKGVAA